MTHFFVMFDTHVREIDGIAYVFSPHFWVTAEDEADAELRARRRLDEHAPADLACTTIVPYTDEAYWAEMRRLRERAEQRGEGIPN